MCLFVLLPTDGNLPGVCPETTHRGRGLAFFHSGSPFLAIWEVFPRNLYIKQAGSLLNRLLDTLTHSATHPPLCPRMPDFNPHLAQHYCSPPAGKGELPDDLLLNSGQGCKACASRRAGRSLSSLLFSFSLACPSPRLQKWGRLHKLRDLFLSEGEKNKIIK